MTISQYKQERDIGRNSIAIDQVEKVLGKMQKEFENINITMHALANKINSELYVNNTETISRLRNENTLLCDTLEVLTLELANRRMSSKDPTAYSDHQSKPDDSAVETAIVYNANSHPASRTNTISHTHTTTEKSCFDNQIAEYRNQHRRILFLGKLHKNIASSADDLIQTHKQTKKNQHASISMHTITEKSFFDEQMAEYRKRHRRILFSGKLRENTASGAEDLIQKYKKTKKNQNTPIPNFDNQLTEYRTQHKRVLSSGRSHKNTVSGLTGIWKHKKTKANQRWKKQTKQSQQYQFKKMTERVKESSEDFRRRPNRESHMIYHPFRESTKINQTDSCLAYLDLVRRLTNQ